MIGTKALGLSRMPGAWVPDFVSLVPRSISNPTSREVEHAWSDVDKRLGHRGTLLVRSDGPAERDRPGVGNTVTARLDDLESALRAAGADADGLWPLIQVAIEPGAVGALSNDRRVTPRRDLWLAEGPIVSLQPQVVALRGGPSCLSTEAPLPATDDLRPALRAVASRLGRLDGRYRVEWVWDGRLLWVVQADRLPQPVTDARARDYLPRRPRYRRADRFAADSDWDGPKIRSHATFSRLGLPTVPVHARRAEHLRNDRRLREWLAQILEIHAEPIVLRTDVAEGAGPNVLLPTSAPSRDPTALARFAQQTIRSLAQTDVSSDCAALLASPLVPAVASALARIDADGSVGVDSLWGFPDGLLHLPHDSSVVVNAQVRVLRRRKPACVLLSADVGRLQVSLGAPWDWGWTINADEARTIASWTTRVSQAAGCRIQLMVLARVAGRRGEAGLVPFHFFEQPGPPSHRKARPALGRAVLVRHPRDLQGAAEGEWIDLRPDVGLTRDRRFLLAVAEFAMQRDLPIAFAGSRLGHARYILEHHGVTVFAAEDTTTATQTTPVLARSQLGLSRLTWLQLDDAADILSHDLGRDTAGLGLQELVARHTERWPDTAIPGVPRVSDAASARIGTSQDRAGVVIGFTE